MFKYSKIRFYILNSIWNLKFWLYCKKIYQDIEFKNDNKTFIENEYGFDSSSEIIRKKRFVGYYYNNNIYLDNPGIQINDEKLKRFWKMKGYLN